MPARKTWGLVVALAVACGHAPKVADNAHGPAPEAAPPAASATTTAAPASLPLAITNLEPGVFEIAASSPVRLKTEAVIERKTSSGWEALGALDLGSGYRLVTDCSQDAPCADAAPGRALVPVPWSGYNCSAQCNGSCRANSFEGPGAFRLTVRECEGPRASSGPEFELPDVLRAHDLERWGLVADAAKITIARLDFPTKAFDAAAPAAPDHIAGFVVRAGTEKVLDQANADALVALVRDHKGFDDATLERCKLRDLVGFRIERALKTTGAAPRTDTTEIAIDFACDKLFAAHRGAALQRKAIAVHFAPSRPAFLALVKRALPADPQIAKLK